MSEVAVAFFVDDHMRGHQLDKQTDSWNNDMSTPEKKRLCNFCGAIKRAVRTLLCCCDSFPSTFDKECLGKVFSDAENRLRDNLGFEPQKNVTVHLLIQHPESKKLEKTLKPPENTPDPLWKVFKSD